MEPKYDHVGNIAGLCKACHHGPDGVHQRKEAEDQLKEIKEGVRQKYKVGLLNSAMPRLLDEARDFCEERGIVFTITDGKATAEARSKFSLKKDHCLDAYAISLADREIWKGDVTVADVVYERRRFKKASKNMISARNQRVYSLGGKAVAYNRHKATDQQEDSLEEFLEAFKKGHSEPQCRQLIHRLEISPAKRTYTYHKKGLKPPVRPGDVVLYEKKNKVKGNTKRWVFVASSVMYAQSVVSRKGEKSAIREWKVEGAQGGTRKAKFCRPLRSGCVQVVRTRPVSM